MKLSQKLALAESAAAADPSDAAATASAEAAPAAAPAGGKGRSRQPGRAAARSASQKSWEDSKRKVHERVLGEVAPQLARSAPGASTDLVRRTLDRILTQEDIGISPLERRRFLQELLQDILGYGPLDPLLADPAVTEIMCNDYDQIWIEREGVIEPVDVAFGDPDQYRRVIEKIVSAVGRRIDEAAPMVDARLPDGSRVNAIVPPLAVHGAVLTIRKFPADPLTMADLIGFGALDPWAAAFLEAAVRGKVNLLVTGGTGTGKTTLLNALSSYIPSKERIITIEDSAELQLQQPHVVALESRPPNAEGSGHVTIRDLVRNSLRMRPDRIIVGECRGPEALDMLQAMNTGHEGSMTTVHANSPRESLSRLETMVMMAGYDLPLRAIRDQISSSVEVIVHLVRLPSGRRVVQDITEIQGMEGDVILLQDVFRRSGAGQEEVGRLLPTGLRPKLVGRLAERGVEVPAAAFRTDSVLTGESSSPGRARGGRIKPGALLAAGRTS